MKEAVAAVLSEKYKVLKTSENLNTPLGISELIQKELNPSYEIMIVEMGEYVPGDVKQICDLVKPQMAIITGINAAHLERMGNIENTIATIFEIAENGSAEIFLNADDPLTVKNYKRYVQPGRKVYFYGANSNELLNLFPKNIQFKEDPLSQEFDLYQSQKLFGKFKINLLGDYAVGTFAAAASIGLLLNLTVDQIARGVSKLRPIKHRLEPLFNPNGTIVIDDSYNGNPDGVDQALKLLKRFAGRRKIYITPGLVEAGSKAAEIHREIGKKIAAVADLVILIKNSVTKNIQEGLKSQGFSDRNIMLFNSAQQAHQALAGIVRPGDVVLFQNDWPDNYL